jgi:hypothetical protein
VPFAPEDVVMAAPPAPTEKLAVPDGVRLIFDFFEYAPPPPPDAPVALLAFEPPEPPAPKHSTVLLPLFQSEGTLHGLELAVVR